MSAISKRQFPRRGSARKPLSEAAGLLLAACLVTVMTLWATSSPFSPLSQKFEVEPAVEPVQMRQEVRDAFALSESVLPPLSLEPVAEEIQNESLPALSEMSSGVSDQAVAVQFARLEQTHTLEQEDRAAWLSFRRQEPLSTAQPVARAEEVPLREIVATDASNLPEVHFASADLRPEPLQPDQSVLETVLPLPTEEILAIDKSSVKEQQPTRVATLPEARRDIAPRPNRTSAVKIVPYQPQRSWETGRY